MPAVYRELAIDYGDPVADGVRFGGDSERVIHAYHSFEVSYETGEVSWTFAIERLTQVDFETEVQLLEARLRNPAQRIRVYVTDEAGVEADWIDWNPATNTGFNARCALVKDGRKEDSGRTRLLRVTCNVDLPADAVGTDGRREDTSIEVAFSPSRRRTLTVAGTWTAVPGGPASARAQYTAEIAGYIGVLTAAFGGTWERALEPSVSTDSRDKVVTFSIVFKEKLFADGAGGIDDPELVDPSFTFEVNESSGANSVVDGAEAQPPIAITATYSTGVDQTLTKDIEDKWADDILPYLVDAIAERTGIDLIALESAAPRFDPIENRIDASLRLTGYGNAGDVLRATETTEDDIDNGIDLVPVWDGNRFSKEQFPGPATHTRTVTTTTRKLSTSSKGGAGGGGAGVFGFGGVAGSLGGLTRGLAGNLGGIAKVGSGGGGRGVFGFGARQFRFGGPGAGGAANQGGGAAGGGQNFVELRTRRSRTPLRIGLKDAGRQVDVVDETRVTVSERADTPTAGSFSPGGGTTVARSGGPGQGVRPDLGAS